MVGVGGKRCAANGCCNGFANRCKERGIGLHGFPFYDPKLLKMWVDLIGRDGFNPTKGSSFLCSEHFKEDDFTYQPFTNRRSIKRGAIPSIFPPGKAKRRLASKQCVGTRDVEEASHDCEKCNAEPEVGCPLHGPLVVVRDKTVSEDIKGGLDFVFSRCTLPDGLSIKKSRIPLALLGVFATKPIAARTRFGPYGGVMVENTEKTQTQEPWYCWQIFNEGQLSHFISGKDPDRANWMRYVNFAPSDTEKNLSAYQHQGNIYFCTLQSIKPGSELLVHYSEKYTQDINNPKQSIGPVEVQSAVMDTNVKKEQNLPCLGPQQGVLVYSPSNMVFSQECMERLQRSTDYTLENLIILPVSLQSPTNNKRVGTDCQHDDQNGKSKVKSESIPHQGLAQQIPTHNLATTNLLSHRLTHIGEKPCQSDDCDRGFTHPSKERQEDGKPYNCDICGEVFCSEKNILLHRCTHTGEKPYKCDFCGKGFMNSHSIHGHKLRFHGGTMPYKCGECGTECPDLCSIQRHMRGHTGIKPYECDVCSKKFGDAKVLRMHKLFKHEKQRPFLCDVCGQGCCDSSALQTHMQRHTGVRPFECDLCGKRLYSKGALHSHKLLHTGEKPYLCDVCGKRFRKRCRLSQHKRSHHSD